MKPQKSQIQELVDKGLISEEQAQSILAYGNNNLRKSWITQGFLILGAIVICLGVLSIIAANFYSIPGNLKLTINFILLSIQAAFIFKLADQRHTFKFNILVFIYIIFCLISIALIGQVYNTSNELYLTLLFWSATTFIPVCYTNRTFVSFIWLMGPLTSAFSANIKYNAIDSALFPGLLAMLLFTISSSTSLNMKAIKKALYIWGIVNLTQGVIWIDFIQTTLDLHQNYYTTTNAFYKFSEIENNIITWSFFLLLAKNILDNINYTKIQKNLFIVVLLLYNIEYLISSFYKTPQVLTASFTLIIFSTIAIALASLKYKKLFNLFLFLTGIRFLVLYFQALGGLATTGAGLILAGIIIITLAVLWKKHSSTILKNIERWSNNA